MAQLTDAELKRAFAHLVSAILNGKTNPINRSNDFFVDHNTRLGHIPIPLEIQPLITRISPFLTLFKDNLAIRNTDIGGVTDDVSKFDTKFDELPALLDGWESQVRIAMPGDNDTLKYLYFTNRKVFRVGSEGDKMLILNGWLLRLATKPLITSTLAQITTWVNALDLLLSTKGIDKDIVTVDRSGIEDIQSDAYDAMFQNLGDLMILYPGNLAKILSFFNTNLLVPNEVNPKRVFKNVYSLENPESILMNLPQVKHTLTNIFLVENSTDEDIQLFKSVNIETLVPDYAITIPAHSKVKIAVLDLGPRTSLYLMIAFAALPVTGKVKITVRKN